MSGKLPKITAKSVRNFFVLLAIVGVSFFGGYQFRNGGGVLGSSLPAKINISREVPNNVDFALFWKVWDTLKTSYYDPSKIHDQDLVYGAIKGMVAAVGDPYTVFLTPGEQKVTSEDLSGNFEGVGIEIGYRGRDLAVIAPLPGSPAEEAGIKAGDIIAAIKDEAKKIDKGTDGMSLPEAVQIIRGPAGTKISLALVRDGVDRPIKVDVTRKSISVPSVVTEYLGDKKEIAHIKLLKFGGETRDEWVKAIDDVTAHGSKKIILDLRNNPGGYLQAAVDIASEFLPVGTEVVYEEANGQTIDKLNTVREGRLTDATVVVLINKGSASASEILSGALRDQKHIKLVGDTSFGKGTVQEPRELESGTGIHITIAKWLTPSGVWVHEKGLTPDVSVKDNPDTKDDEQLNAALKLLK